MSLNIAIVDQQTIRKLTDEEESRLQTIVEAILTDHQVHSAELSIAILDDATIQHYNREYLQHDWPTDAISFLLSDDDDSVLEGQLLLSRETADHVATELPWNGDVELLLYAIHGTLHLVGYDDATPHLLIEMRDQERKYLRLAGVPQADDHPHFEDRSKFDG